MDGINDCLQVTDLRLLASFGVELDLGGQRQTRRRLHEHPPDRYFQSEIPVGFSRQNEPQRHPQEGVDDGSSNCETQQQAKHKSSVIPSVWECVRLTSRQQDRLWIEFVQPAEVVQDRGGAGGAGQQRCQSSQL